MLGTLRETGGGKCWLNTNSGAKQMLAQVGHHQLRGLEQIIFLLLQKWIMSTLLRGFLRGLSAIKYLVFKVFSSEYGMYEAFIKW